MSEMSLQARVEARLAKHKQMQSSLKPSELVSQSVYTNAPSIPRAPLSMAPVYALTSTLNDAQNQLYNNQRELTQTRSKVLTLERYTQSYEQELKNKDSALRKTLAEATGERMALVEALTTARASVDYLKIDSSRKDDLIYKLETRIASQQQDFDDMNARLQEMTTSMQSDYHELKFAREQLNVLETKISITEKENEKLISERNELKDATLENRVLKSKLGQLDHEYQTLSQKFKSECDTNLNVRAELVQLKQEYADVLGKFSSYTEEYDKYKRISAKFEELSREHDDLSRKYRDLVDVSQEAQFRQEKDSKLLAAEREAAQKLGSVMKAICAMQAADDYLKVQGVEETVCYLQIQPVLLKLRQIVDINKQLRDESDAFYQQYTALKKEHQALSAQQQELQIKAETLGKANERLSAAFEQNNAEVAQVKQNLQAKENQYNKLVMECQLAMAVFNQKGEVTAISKMCQTLNQQIQQLTKEKEVLNQELDELACKYNGLEQANENAAGYNLNLVQEIDVLKRKLQDVKEESNSVQYTKNQLMQTVQNLGQFVALLLRQVNCSDRRAQMARQTNQIASISLLNYAKYTEQTIYLCYTYEESDKSKARLDGARRKIRKAIFAYIFINRLKNQAELASQQNYLEIRAFYNIAPKNSQFAQIIAAIVGQHVYYSGDLEGYGIAALQSQDRAYVLQKVLSRCFYDCMVYRLGLPETLNLAFGQFTDVSRRVCGVFQAKDSVINELALQNSDVLNQHSQVSAENDGLRKALSELKERFVVEYQKYLNLQGSLPQNYVPISQHQELLGQNNNHIAQISNQDQKIGDLTHQIQSMSVEIQSYQNEISRLNATIQSSDQLVKTINAKFEEQMKAAVNMRELMHSYEMQIQQKDYDINSKNEELLKLKQQQQLAAADDQKRAMEVEQIRRNLRDRDAQLQQLQAQFDKETRLRILAENAATAQLRQAQQGQQGMYGQQNPQAAYTRPPAVPSAPAPTSQQPRPAAARPKEQVLSSLSTDNDVREFKSAVNKSEIYDLIKQLNMSLGDE